MEQNECKEKLYNEWPQRNGLNGRVKWYKQSQLSWKWCPITMKAKQIQTGGFGRIEVHNPLSGQSKLVYFNINSIDQSFMVNKIKIQRNEGCCVANVYTNKNKPISQGLFVFVDLQIHSSVKFGVELHCEKIRLANNDLFIKRYNECKQGIHNMSGVCV